MPAHRLPADLEAAFRNGLVSLTDPGAGGTIPSPENKGIAHVEIVTTGAESRALPSPTGLALGTTLFVFLKTYGGVLTITGGSPSAFTMTTAGSVVEWVVGSSGTSKVWRVVGASQQAQQAYGTKTIDIPIGNSWRNPTTLTSNLAATSSTGVCALVSGTHGTSAPSLNTNPSGATNPSNLTFGARNNTDFKLPSNYRAGTNVTLRFTVTELAASSGGYMDCIVTNPENPSVNLMASGATGIVGGAVCDMVVTGTNLSPGDNLDVYAFMFLNGSGTNCQYAFTDIKMIYTAG